MNLNLRLREVNRYALAFAGIFLCGLALLFSYQGWGSVASAFLEQPALSLLFFLPPILVFGGALYLLWRISRKSAVRGARATALLYAVFAMFGFFAACFVWGLFVACTFRGACGV
jgi:hypothetical protein